MVGVVSCGVRGGDGVCRKGRDREASQYVPAAHTPRPCTKIITKRCSCKSLTLGSAAYEISNNIITVCK